MTYAELRKAYPTFEYNSYEIEDKGSTLHITYNFVMGEHSFSPTWEIPKKYEVDGYAKELIFSLGLVELISYWKTACPPTVIVNAGYLSDSQIAFWKKLYFKGLGEFFYTNGIDSNINDFMTIRSTGDKISDVNLNRSLAGCLIPVGGGKDSVVTMELLKPFKKDNSVFIINPRRASLGCVNIAGYENSLFAPKRTLDPHMIQLNSMGYLNGHTPFSALAAFSAVLAAYLNGKKYVPLSNESSANESTVIGLEVNHQYSKSFEFEADFRGYIEQNIPCGVEYFSLLRPYSEFQIGRFFAQQQDYFYMFKSCNVGSKTDIWCGACPKCLFVWLILSPFISHDMLCEIFGTDMLRDKNMLPTFDKLVGIAPEKPFECVGSIDEVNAAICLTIDTFGDELPLLFDYYVKKGLFDKYKDKMHSFNKFFDKRHFIPDKFSYTFDLMLKS